MKIQGNSKIISKVEATADSKVKTESATKTEKEEVVIKATLDNKVEKEALESLVTEAEVVDLIHEDVPATPKTKLRKIKDATKNLIDKTKPFRDEQKKRLRQAVVKARGLSPHADKLITALDKSVSYITNPNPLDGRSDVVQDTRAPSIFGIWVMIITFGFFMMWAVLAPLDSASHAIGKIILASKKRIIQSAEHGIINEILVKDGQEVTKGQILIKLDDTQAKAKQQQIQYRYFSILAEVAKLTARKDGLSEINFPENLLAHAGDPEVHKMIQSQEKAFTAKEDAYNSRVDHTKQQIAQNIEKKNALLPQIEANSSVVRVQKEQVESYRKLYKNKNISIVTLRDAETRYAEAVGREGGLRASLAENEQLIIQSKIAVDTFKNEDYEKVTSDLKEQQANLSVMMEQLNEVNETLSRMTIRTPETGIVSALSEHLTPQGFIQMGTPLMEIIPQDDELVIEAKIPASDIASVRIGQTTKVRLTAYRPRVFPALDGKLVSLAADISYPDPRDAQLMGPQPFYRARIVIDADQLEKVAQAKDVQLYPGMGVDVMIVIGTRTMMQYLMDPITMTLDHSFRER